MDASMFSDMAKKTTKKWTTQRKAEERSANARMNRRVKMVKTCKVTVKDVAYDYMDRAYLKASANGTLPAAARQIMYAARGYIQDKTGEVLDSTYFRGLLIDYMLDYPGQTAGWNVTFDPRGNFIEPHTDRTVPVGTLHVASYLRKVKAGAFVSDSVPVVAGGPYPTVGVKNRCSAVMFIEKEGFMPLFNAAKLAEKYDLAIISTKGMPVVAARRLVDQLCKDAPLLIVRDFDKAGFSIASTIQKSDRRYRFRNSINVIDLGLRLEDAKKWELESEQVSYSKTSAGKVRANLEKNGATTEEIDYLCEDTVHHWSAASGQRIELNAFASDQLIEWLESKLEENGIEKLIPDAKTLEKAYRRSYKLKKLQKVIDKQEKRLSKKSKKLEIPDNLEEQLQEILDQNPELPWDKAIHRVKKNL